MRGRTGISRGACLIPILAIPAVSPAESSADENVALCAEAADPPACLESYGYECRTGRDYTTSLEARQVNCDIVLSDTHAQFVQMLYDDGTWSIQHADSYELDYSEPPPAAEHAGMALSERVSAELDGYFVLSSGGGYSPGRQSVDSTAGARRVDERRAFRAACGVIERHGHFDEAMLEDLRAECERVLLRTIRRGTQPPGDEPYRAGGKNDIEWRSQRATLANGDTAMLLIGESIQPRPGPACLAVSGCCSSDGVMYLDSCREPTVDEFGVIEDCLDRGIQIRTDEFHSCLRDAGVRTGCEDRPDGSRLCY